MKRPFVIKFPKMRINAVEKKLINSKLFIYPVKMTHKRIGRQHLYLIITQFKAGIGLDKHNKLVYADKLKAEITHQAPNEDTHTYLADNTFPLKELEALFRLQPEIPME